MSRRRSGHHPSCRAKYRSFRAERWPACLFSRAQHARRCSGGFARAQKLPGLNGARAPAGLSLRDATQRKEAQHKNWSNAKQFARTSAVLEKEDGLARQLSTRQMAMIAIGGAIGTGLFLGSSLAVRTACPAVIVSYPLGAGIALLLMGALSEMAVAHPTAGSFGVYAELYVNRWAGYA